MRPRGRGLRGPNKAPGRGRGHPRTHLEDQPRHFTRYSSLPCGERSALAAGRGASRHESGGLDAPRRAAPG